MKRIFTLTLFATLLFAAFVNIAVAKENHTQHNNTKKGDVHSEHPDEGAHDNALGIAFSEEKLKRFGANLAIAQGGKLNIQVELPAEIQLNREAVAHITPQYPAKITEVKARIGDRVQAGQVLARAESSETLARFNLKSLIDGVVINRHITLGEHLLPSDTAFVVADLSTLWVDIALYPKQIDQVEKGQSVTLRTAHATKPAQSTIDYIAPIVDETTRTGLARVFLDNKNNQWKPGQFVDATITLEQYSAQVAVPQTAIIQLKQKPVVFVQRGQQWFAQPVEIGRSDKTHVEITEGLNPGDRYVSEGGFVLKAEMNKANFESGHNH